MGYQGKGKKNISANSSEEKWDYINRRAERLKWSVSMFAGAIIDNWLAAGAPPVDRIEDGLPKIPYDGPIWHNQRKR